MNKKLTVRIVLGAMIMIVFFAVFYFVYDSRNNSKKRTSKSTRESAEDSGKLVNEKNNENTCSENVCNVDSMTNFQVVDDMGAGWNLGCSLECFVTDNKDTVYAELANVSDEEKNAYYETLWGNVQTTKELIDTIKAAGFRSVRVPVTYADHLDGDKIDEAWLNRVEEVASYVVDSGMYCIINVHHDTGEYGQITAEPSNTQTTAASLENLWQQIAEHFKDFDEHLLFEGFNEILNNQHLWSNAGEESYQTVNTLNQTFVDTVRKTGGNNTNRILIVNTYAANTEDDMLGAFVLPKDSQKDRLVAEVHCYKTENLEYIFSQLKAKFIDNGIPLILGEFGMNASTDVSARVEYAKVVRNYADNLGIAYFWWDDGGNVDTSDDVYNYALLNRSTLQWYFPEIVQALTN